MEYMNLPERFPFQVIYYVDGKPMSTVPREHIKQIKLYDPQHEKRLKFEKEMDERFVQKLPLFSALYDVYSSTLYLRDSKSISNPLLLFVVEQSVKQYVNDLDAMIKDFIKYINQCMGDYKDLFRKDAQKKIVEVSIASNLECEKEYRQKSDIIDTKRNELFFEYSSKVVPTDDNFIKLKDKISGLRQPIKEYRDKVASHPEKDIIFYWSDLGGGITRFRNIIFDFYLVGSFRNPPVIKKTVGIDPDRTAKYLISGIFE